MLAGLYMGRSDTALMVRQSALHVWKVGSTSNLLNSGLKIIMSNRLCIVNLFSNSERCIYKSYPYCRPPTKFREANVFTRGWGEKRGARVGISGAMSFQESMGISGTRSLLGTACPRGCICPEGVYSPPRPRIWDTMGYGRQAGRLILLECFLVLQVIVTHTPKTLREILSTLFQLLLGCLASSSYDKRQVCSVKNNDFVLTLWIYNTQNNKVFTTPISERQ